LFGDLSNRYSFQIWIQNGPSGNIWFTYGQLGTLFLPATVGIENHTVTDGQSYFYNAMGTPPAVGTDLEVDTTIGGTNTISFQAEIKKCHVAKGSKKGKKSKKSKGSKSSAIVNRANITSGGVSETAIAVTQCVK
jgi:hypothetical protein